MSDKILFHERMREARLKSGLSQAELSRLTNISPATLSTYESIGNPKNPPIDKAIAIAKALNVSLDWLCGQEEKSNDETDEDVLDVENVINAVITLSKLKNFKIDHFEGYSDSHITISIEGFFLCSFVKEYKKIMSFMNDPYYPNYLKSGLRKALLDKFVDNYYISNGEMISKNPDEKPFEEIPF